MPGPTIPQTQNILQSYFQTGDIPTQNQFLELIGTIFYLYTIQANAAAAALAAANAATAAVAAQCPAVLFQGTVNTGISGTDCVQIGNSVGISAIVVIPSGLGAGAKRRLTFTTPFADTNYKVLYTAVDANGESAYDHSLILPLLVFNKNTNYMDVNLQNMTPTVANTTFSLAIWP